jgi:hypothetical protein
MLPIEIKQRILYLGVLKELVAIARPKYIYNNEVLHQLTLATNGLRMDWWMANRLYREVCGNTWEKLRDWMRAVDGPKKRLVEPEDTLDIWRKRVCPVLMDRRHYLAMERPSY